ncbi:hypothetical protein DMH04_38100 [Kibdelosporangium aridum]|uniref:DnaB-like helicase N terminal domain-containing protein n=1 Tax=Kibdelosporangium aridum TaxID=2030 RepID=A0A428YYF4_KIBAR|nr:hypothetical protein [Kibdelosporangium aridum]RSM75541.1 hypothetical protein DMH04_38100 [Kibdelosporangium aridum]
MLPTTDLEAAVVGVLMQLTPDAAQPHLDHLESSDFTDWRAAAVAKLLTDLCAAGLPSLDPAAVVGYALRTGAVSGEHKLKRIAEWAADAYRAAPIVPASLDFHVGLLVEASYRRHVVMYAKRLLQAETSGALDLLDEQITAGYARLAAHRQRFTTTPTPLHVISNHVEQGAA